MGPVREKMGELMGLLEENLRSYTALLDLADEMHAELNGGKVDRLSEKMGRRKELQEEISKRDKLINGIGKDLPRVPPDQRITALVDRAVSLATAIQQLDQKSRKLMEEEQGRLREDLAELRQGKKALQRYKGKANEHPKFFDRCG